MRIRHWLYTAPLRLRSILRRRQVELELDEELQFHLDNKVDEGVARGLAPDEARRRALRDMGLVVGLGNAIEQHKERIRDTRRVGWWTDFLADLRFASRSLRRTPGLTAFVVLTLAVGIGMTATPFSMLDALIFRPYPVPDSDSVVTLMSTSHDNAFDNFSFREYLDIRERTTSYAGVVASTATSAVGFAAEPEAMPRIKGATLVSANYFSTLGVEPTIGRAFRADEDQVPGRDRVVVLGPDLWRSEFASNPAVVGRTIRLNGTDFTVIGVAPENFTGMQIFLRPDLYVPLAMAPLFSTNPQKLFFEDRDARELTVRGRLAAGATLEEARNELAALGRDFERAHPALYRDRGTAVRTRLELRTRGDDINWKFGVIFMILALSVLLVACTNVAGLLLSRGRARTREIAVRLALGAGRFRLVRLLLTETLILACLGGLGGIAIGYLGIELLSAFQIPTDLPVKVPFRMDLRVLVASLALGVASALFVGLTPALQGTRSDLVKGLNASDTDVPGRRRRWGRNALVIAQVALSLMLLTASFLMARSFRRSVEGSTTAQDHDRLLLARFDPRLGQYDSERTRRFYEELVRRVREAPGVESAALMTNPPLGLDSFAALAFVPEGFEMPRDRENFTATMDVIDEGFFTTMGIPLLHGRDFTRVDTAERTRVAIVNEQFARHYWPDSDPALAVGRRLRLREANGPAVEIVGVAKTVDYKSTGERPLDFIYLPLAQNPKERMVLMVRTDGEALTWLDSLRTVVRTLDPNLPILETRTYADLYRYHAVEGPGVAIKLVGTLGGVGLLLAVAGLYGLIAYNVSRRTREIGIRMAIGAGPASVLRLMMSKGLVLVAIGTGIGLAMGVAIERLMNSMLFNVGGFDLVAYLVVVPSMVLVTILAAYVPARRASRIPPTLALRYE